MTQGELKNLEKLTERMLTNLSFIKLLSMLSNFAIVNNMKNFQDGYMIGVFLEIEEKCFDSMESLEEIEKIFTDLKKIVGN